MSAANPERVRWSGDEIVRIKMVESGEIKDVSYRRAVSLLSRGMAVYPSDEDQSSEASSPASDTTTSQVLATEQGSELEDLPDGVFVSDQSDDNLSAPVEDDVFDQEGENAENKPLFDE